MEEGSKILNMTVYADKRAHTRDQVSKLLDERQEMLVLFCQLAGLEPYQSSAPVDYKLRDILSEDDRLYRCRTFCYL